MHSPIISDKLLVMRDNMANPNRDQKEAVWNALQEMGPGCLADQFDSDEEARGAYKVLEWIDRWLTYDPAEI